MNGFISYITSVPFFETLAIILVVILLLEFIKRYLIKKVAYTNKSETHKNTLKGVVFNILQYVILIGGIFLILQVNGLNINGILAGLGIFATIVGLSLQDTIKDIIGGINIYNNNFYKVGDVVKFEDDYWEVKYFNARVTKFKNILMNTTYTVANSNITQIEKIKETCVFKMCFDFDTDKDKVKELFDNLVPLANDLYGVREAVNVGPLFITPEGVTFGLMYKANPRLFPDANVTITGYAYQEAKRLGISPASNSDFTIHMADDEPIEKAVKKKVKKTK